MLSPTKVRYVQICEAKISTQKPNRELAVDFDVEERTIDRALAWGKQQGFFDKSIAEKLNKQIAEVNEHLHWLEQELKLVKRFSKEKTGKKIPSPHRYIAVLSRELRETRTLLMELEGIYKQTINLNHSGSIDSAVHIYLPDNGRDHDAD